MATSIESYFSSFINGMYVFGGWMSAVPKAIADGFSWFHSKKMDIPDTEQGQRLKEALQPESSLDKLAQTWAHASFWTKGALFVGAALVFGVLGLAFGASVLLSLTSLALGLGVHGILVAHHEERVKRIINHVNLREEVVESLGAINGKVVDFIQTQKKEAEETFIQFKKETQELAEAVTAIDKEVNQVITVNKQLVEAGQRIEKTLTHLEKQTLEWNETLEQHQNELGTTISATNNLASVVDSLARGHKQFDTTVSQLHDAVAELAKPMEEGDDLTEGLLGELSDANKKSAQLFEESHQMLDQIDATVARFEQRKETEYKDSNLFISKAVIVQHLEGIKAAKKELEQVDIRMKQHAVIAEAEQKEQEESLIQLPHQPKEELSSLLSKGREQLEEIRIEQEQIRADIKELDAASGKGNTLPDQQTFVRTVEEELKVSAEKIKERRARLEAYARFFAADEHNLVSCEIPKPGLRTL